MARRPTNHARHAALSRLHKRTLLPLPQKAVDAMALEYHAALAALASGQGSRHGVELLQQLVVIARFIGETSSTRLDPALLEQLTAALQAVLERGTATGEWLIDAADRALCAALVIEHERQLRVIPIGSLEKAVDRAKHFATACRDKEE
ncbi:Fis family transcriptional regulator (plasmid) [Burkholderia plantarii]|uniref:Fis family transcriptional regulator n=1 Tax=Burkholderia plantarii TaxID=41899 RepID=UPI00272B152A|nr:Fis family transcriptional regulator [Burkholderia plantarii]WLE64175.1 Fis family transcriptional regulator [Burkholderia plantarii]